MQENVADLIEVPACKHSLLQHGKIMFAAARVTQMPAQLKRHALRHAKAAPRHHERDDQTKVVHGAPTLAPQFFTY